MPPPRITSGPSPAAARVRALADEQGVTISELAARAGVHRNTAARFLAGRGDLAAGNLRALLDALGARWADLDAPPD